MVTIMEEGRMRKVSGVYWDCSNGKREEIPFDLGFFHGWGVASTEFDVGGVTDTIAIVEFPDGKVITTTPRSIRFLAAEYPKRRRT
jgi:hypothetical protein